MANRSYLCVSSTPTLYPSSVDPKYNLKKSIIAHDVYCVPLLWMALFRSADLQTTTILDDENQPCELTAPVVSVSTALAQLRTALPALNRVFATEGALDEYADLFSRAFDGLGSLYVTIEMAQIVWLYPDGEFDTMFRAALECFDQERGDAADRNRLVQISQLRTAYRFPPARAFVENLAVSADDCWNHSRLLGASLYRATPWDSPPT